MFDIQRTEITNQKNTPTMMKLASLCLLLSFTHGWMTDRGSLYVTSRRQEVTSFLSTDGMTPEQNSAAEGAESAATENPCWQDLYDDDCMMSNVYAASFVASKWIKSLPCGAGLEVCSKMAHSC
jgi:hypothetical protein